MIYIFKEKYIIKTMAKKGKKHNGHKKTSGDMVTIRSRTTLTINSPLANGTFSGTALEIDTDWIGKWQLFATIYQFWKIHDISFQYVPIVGTQNLGTIAVCIVEDPSASTPGSINDVMTCRCAKIASIKDHFTLKYRPTGFDKNWLYTQDRSLNENRLEIYGYFFYATLNCSATTVPGQWVINYKVSFKGQNSINVNLSNPLGIVQLMEKHTENQVNRLLDIISEDIQTKGVSVDKDKLKKIYNLGRTDGVNLNNKQKVLLPPPEKEITGQPSVNSPRVQPIGETRMIGKFP